MITKIKTVLTPFDAIKLWKLEGNAVTLLFGRIFS